MQKQSIENKQQYLREHILDKGYDPEAFMIYCDENMGKIDLEEWNFQKLVMIVQSFIDSVTNQACSQEELENNQDWTDYHLGDGQDTNGTKTVDNRSQIKNQPIVFSQADWGIFGVVDLQPKNSQTNISMGYPTLSMPKQETKPTKQQRKLQLQINSSPKTVDSVALQNIEPMPASFRQKGNGKITKNGTLKIQLSKIKELGPLPPINDIIIVKTQQYTKNFLKGQQTIYHIKLNPCNHTITKKFSDFRSLRNILHKIYPHIRLPYIQPQGWLANSSQGKYPDILNKYKYQVIEFFKYILIRNQILKKSKVVRIFSGLSESKQNQIKKYQTVKKPKKFMELCLTGNQIVFDQLESLSPVDKYMTNTQFLMTEIQGCYDKLKKSLETLFYNYDQTTKSLTQVSTIFESLQNYIHKFNIENDTSKDLRIYEGIKQVCLRLREQINIQQSIFRDNFQSFFRYEKQNMGTYKEINQVRTKMYSEYLKHGQMNKQPTQKTGEITLLDGDMPIDDICKNNKNILRVQNMFWSHFTLEAVHQYWHELRQKINEKLTMLAYEKLDNQNDSLNFWNTIIKRCVM